MKTDVSAIIVDDEERGIVALERVLTTYCSGVKIVGTAQNIHDAEKLVKTLQPDVLFLDIQMPGGDGFKLLEQLGEVLAHIVFVTAYHEYAIKAIKFGAFDYLLKPVNIDEVQTVINKVHNYQTNKETIERKLQKQVGTDQNVSPGLVLSAMDGYYPIKLKDILYCKGENTYTHFYLTDGVHHIVSTHLKEYEELLQAQNFFRIHKSYIVNLDHIRFVARTDPAFVIMINNDELPVSFRRKQDFLHKLRTHMLTG